MFVQLIIKYFHPVYNIRLQDIRNAWLLDRSTYFPFNYELLLALIP